LVHSTSGRFLGGGITGTRTIPGELHPVFVPVFGSGPQLPELCVTTRGGAPLPVEVISALRAQAPLLDSVETYEKPGIMQVCDPTCD